jgi:hypothetical protein
MVVAGDASGHTISQIRENPRAFDQQVVTVIGEVANVVTRYGETSYSTFDLVTEKGMTLAILVSQKMKCLQGDICRVSGLFVAERNIVLPDDIERISEAGYREAGVLFRPIRGRGKRRNTYGTNGGGGTQSGSDGRLPRGMYMPD